MTEHTRCDGTPECPSESHAQSCWKWRPMTDDVMTCPCAICGSQRRALALPQSQVASTGEPEL